MTREERTAQKIAELMEIYAELPEDKLKVATDLIRQAAFSAVMLEDLSESISKNGTVETYQNGANQSGRKVSSDAKLYSTLISKYATITTKLLQMIPEQKRDHEAEREAKRAAELAHKLEVDNAQERAKRDMIRRIADQQANDALRDGVISQDEYVGYRDKLIKGYGQIG